MNDERPHERTECGAATRSGSPCKRAPLPNGRCNLHGGKSLTGIASPSLRTGRHSRYLPARLLDRYNAAVSDSELLALRDDLALLDARLSDLLERVDSGESGERWTTLQKAWDGYCRFRGSGTTDEIIAWHALEDLFEQSATDYAAWGEIHVILEQRRKVSESEQKRLVAMAQVITSEQAMTFVTAIQASIKRHISDPKTLRAIALDMQALSNHGAAVA